MSRSVLRWSFLAGLLLAALAASTVVALKFERAPELGCAWRGWLYPPWAVVGWWRAWGHAEPYRRPFLHGLTGAGALVLAPLTLAYLVQLHGPLRLRGGGTGLGTPAELCRSGQITTRGPGIVLGQARSWWCGRQVFRATGDQHVIVFGASGSGKSTTTAIPTALLHPGSLLLVDPSATVSEVASRRRLAFGPVHAFDPTRRGAARFNPLLELPADARLIGACQMGAVLLTGGGKEQGPKDPFWDRSAGYLLSGLLHHARLSRGPTLGHVWRLLQAIDVGRYPAEPTPFAAGILDGFKKREAKLRDSMVATAISHLQFLADPLVQRATAGSDFRAGDLQAADTPVTVAIAIPEDQAERLRPLTRLVLQSLLKPLMHDRRTTVDGRTKRRGTLVMVDDFPALGFMELLELGLADARKYGLRFCLLAQGLEQIEKHYTANQAITGNCGTWSVIPGLSGKTLKAAALLAGQHAVSQAGKQHGFSLKGSSSLSESETLRAVLDPRDMLLRARDETLILTAGCRPTWLRKIACWRERPFKAWADLAAPAAAIPAIRAEELPPWLQTHRV